MKNGNLFNCLRLFAIVCIISLRIESARGACNLADGTIVETSTSLVVTSLENQAVDGLVEDLVSAVEQFTGGSGTLGTINGEKVVLESEVCCVDVIPNRLGNKRAETKRFMASGGVSFHGWDSPSFANPGWIGEVIGWLEELGLEITQTVTDFIQNNFGSASESWVQLPSASAVIFDLSFSVNYEYSLEHDECEGCPNDESIQVGSITASVGGTAFDGTVGGISAFGYTLAGWQVQVGKVEGDASKVASVGGGQNTIVYTPANGQGVLFRYRRVGATTWSGSQVQQFGSPSYTNWYPLCTS